MQNSSTKPPPLIVLSAAAIFGVSVGAAIVYLAVRVEPAAEKATETRGPEPDQVVQQLDEYEELTSEIWSSFDSLSPSFGQTEIRVLTQVMRQCRTTDERTGQQPITPSVARTHYLEAAAAFTLQQYKPALRAVDKALTCYSSLVAEFPDPEIQLRQAIAFNLRCCIATEIGQIEVASQSATEARNILESIPSIGELSPRIQECKYFSIRNMAITKAFQGSSGVDLARHAVKEFDGRFGRIGGANVLDATLLLANMYAQAKEFQKEKAELTAASELIEELNSSSERQRRQVRPSPSLRWIPSLSRAIEDRRQTLGQMNQEDSAPNSAAPLNRCPVPVQFIPGQSIHTDILIRAQMPPEFEPQHGFAMVWRSEKWEHPMLLKVAKELSKTSLLYILPETGVPHHALTSAIRKSEINQANLRILDIPTESRWLRDYGPIGLFVPEGQPLFLDAKYSLDITEPRPFDEMAPRHFSRLLDTQSVRTPLFIQGGEILVNGSGLCVASRMLLERNIREGMSEDFLRTALRSITGANEIMFVPPLLGEPTRHIDWFLTFPSASTVFVGQYGTPDDPNARILDDIAKELSSVQTVNGRLNVVRVPMPPRQRDWFGGTYTNVVYTNHAILVPRWNDAPEDMEKEVEFLYEKHAADRDVVWVECDLLGYQQGALHCMIINIPAVGRTPRVRTIHQ